MATRSLGKLTIDLVLNTANLERGLNKSERSMADLRRRVAAVRRDLNQFGKAAATAFTAYAASITAAVSAAGSAAREIENLASVSNATTTEFQRNTYAARQFGIEQEKLADIYKDVNDRIGDFLITGAGPLADFFETIGPKIGVTINDFARLSGPEALQKFVSSLEEANVSQQEMTFFLEAIASDSTKLIPLLADSGREMGRLGDEAERLGVVLSDIQIDQLVDAKESLDRLGQTFKSLGLVVTASLAPAIESISRGLTETLADSLDDSKGDVLDWGEVFGNVIVFAADAANAAFKTISFTFNSLGDSLGAFAARLQALGNFDGEALDRISADFNERQSQRLADFLDNSDFTAYRDALRGIREEYERMEGIDFITVDVARRTGRSTKDLESYAEGLKSLSNRFKSAADRVSELRAELEKYRGDLSKGEIANIEAEILNIRNSGLQEISVNVKKRLVDPIKEASDEMTEYAKQAARNMQDAFADFLFDPFEDGLRGLLQGLVDTLRQMIANVAASQIFGLLGGGSFGGILGDIFGGGRAAGGPVSAGSAYLVGERGPELFMPGMDGQIIPNGKMGQSVTINQTNYIEGSNVGPDEMVQILDENNTKLKGEFLQELRRGAYQ